MLTKYHNFTTSGYPIKFTARSDYAITGENAKDKTKLWKSGKEPREVEVHSGEKCVH